MGFAAVKLLAALQVALLFGCSAAFAEGGAPGLFVMPHPAAGPVRSYFKLRARPGEVVHAGALELQNPTSRTLHVELGAVDGQTLPTLGSAYAPPASRPHGPARWLALARRRLALSAGHSLSVPLSVTVPRKARPGDHLAGISVQALGQAQTVGGGRVSIASTTRYVIGVEIVLAGARHPILQLTGASVRREPAGLTFFLDARNPGNAILQGVHGGVRIAQGRHTIVARPIEAGTFVSETSIAYPVPAFGRAPAQGTRYRVSAWLDYPGGSAHLSTTVRFGHRQALLQQRYANGAPASTGSGTAWWKIAIAIGLVLYALVTTTLLLRRRRRAVGGRAGP